MFRNLCVLRKNILLSRMAYTSYAVRANMHIGRKYCAKPTDCSIEGVTLADINVHDMAKGDAEFSRNFLTTLSSLNKSESSPGPNPTEEVISEAEIDSVPESPAVGGDSVASSILDRDGMPIVPIEIDGWKNDGEDYAGSHLDIGDDDEYKMEQLLVVPEKREGQFQYKGIKVKLPESASKDIGTYRFRRDAIDRETVADDMRVVKFDQK